MTSTRTPIPVETAETPLRQHHCFFPVSLPSLLHLLRRRLLRFAPPPRAPCSLLPRAPPPLRAPPPPPLRRTAARALQPPLARSLRQTARALRPPPARALRQPAAFPRAPADPPAHRRARPAANILAGLMLSSTNPSSPHLIALPSSSLA
ncbi:hypothetical protein PVAP13_2KG147716 [Panicum virgatum]|uniref:Uncharacterized protein n=1 Tax=Panicum virgatum TaxID=38727 RepID=A0A8T0VY75_PANVG|nr:hypothetical protein PVAP13_2KG147716 [Panicum virgatum]